MRQVRQRVALRLRRSSVTASSRPVNETGWNGRNGMGLGLSSANWMTRPTCSLLMPLIRVITGTISHTLAYTGSRWPAASRRTGCRPCGAGWRRCRCRRTGDTRSAAPASTACWRTSKLLREFDAVGCGLHAVVSNLAGVANSVKEVRRKRGFSAGELH